MKSFPSISLLSIAGVLLAFSLVALTVNTPRQLDERATLLLSLAAAGAIFAGLGFKELRRAAIAST